MGLARIACNISGLPIEDGDEVVVFLATKIKHHSSERMTCYAWDNYNVLRTPIYANYDGVGIYPESTIENNISKLIVKSLKLNNSKLKIKNIEHAIELAHEDGVFLSNYNLDAEVDRIIPIYVLRSSFDTVLKEFKVYGKWTFEELINEKFNEYFDQLVDVAKKVFQANNIKDLDKLNDDEKFERFKAKRLLSFNEHVCFSPYSSDSIESPINSLLALNQNNTDLLDYKKVIGEMVMSNRIDDLKEFLIENLKGIIITKFLGDVGKCWHEPVLFKCETHCLNILKGMTDKYIEEYDEDDDCNI